jgi:amidohydrolase
MMNVKTKVSVQLALFLTVSTALTQEIEKPPEVIPLDELPAETTEVATLRKAVETEIDTYSTRMFEMNDWMYHNPETGHKEVEASKMLASEVEKHGFDVKFGVEGLDEDFDAEIEARYDAKGMPTAFVAKYKGMTEHPVIAFVFEVDALRADRGPFHGCQHNQQGASMVGAAIALSKILEKNNLPGSIWAIHTPAEEIPPPTKAAMVEAGVFDEVDFVIRSHGTGQGARRVKGGLGNCCLLIEAASYEFFGKPSHGASPWHGRDALDAARLFFNAVDMFREHNRPSFRFMGTVTKVGDSPNVTNDYVQVDHWIRNSDFAGREELDAVAEKVDTIAKAAAMATFTEVKIRHYGSYYNGTETAWMQALPASTSAPPCRVSPMRPATPMRMPPEP